MRRIYIAFILLSCLSFWGCGEDWLDVKPSTEIELGDQISSARGFNEILSGVYLTMQSEDLYGHNLTYGVLANISQNHYWEGSNDYWGQFDYDASNAKETIKDIWLGLYNTIANNNIILDNIDAKKQLFRVDDYNIIKGEALAIRAFLHFDALRLFGSAYKDNSEGETQIPYVSSFEIARYPHLTSDKVYEKILNDLDAAEELLLESDPIIGSSVECDFFELDERKYHLNYYAILALKARVYLSKGDLVNAKLYAEKVIDDYQWEWTKESDLAVGSTGKPDVLFFKEVVSALIVPKLQQSYDLYFGLEDESYRANSSDVNYAALIFESDTIIPSDRYWIPSEIDKGAGNGKDDLRYLYLFKNNNLGQKSISIKYDQDFTNIGDQEYPAVPLLRVSEMMLIAAEASLYEDKLVAIGYLNELRERRKYNVQSAGDLTNASEEEILSLIVNEFRKETYLEGQVFYMYKRLGLTEIPTMNVEEPYMPVEASSFIFLLPDDEREFGNIPN